MKQIRHGVFETNSSSIHSLTIFNQSKYDNWKNEGLFINFYSEEMITKEEMHEKVMADSYYSTIDLSDAYDYACACAGLGYTDYQNQMLESVYKTYECEDGETLIAMSFSGYIE